MRTREQIQADYKELSVRIGDHHTKLRQHERAPRPWVLVKRTSEGFGMILNGGSNG